MTLGSTTAWPKIRRAIADNHNRIAIGDIALGKSVADALAESGGGGNGQELVSFSLRHFSTYLLAPPGPA